jgi:hypothetical protein
VKLHARMTAMVGMLALAAPLSLAGGAVSSASAATASVHAPMIPAPGVPGSASSASNSNSTNWSGYAATGGSFTTVSSSWIQPASKCASDPNSYAAFWVGLDGDGTPTVEQTGSDSDCSGTSPRYYAWYEMYPAAPVYYSNPVSPGDAMVASVVKSGTSFVLKISDTTKGWTKSVTKTGLADRGGSAEVITEAPSSGTGVLPLADFVKVNYAASDIDGGSLSAAGAKSITMVKGGVVDSATSALTNSGHNFSNIWKHR